MTRKIISAAAGQWLADNPPPPPTGRGSLAARNAYFSTLTINRTVEYKFEGGSAGYLLDSVGALDLTNNGSAEPVHGGPPLSFASVDSVRFSQTLSYAQGSTGDDVGTGNYAFEMWWRQPPVDLFGGNVPPWVADSELFVLGTSNNNTRVMLGLDYQSEANLSINPYPSSARQGPGGDTNFRIPWEWEFLEDGKIHHIMEVREAATRTNWLVIIDGIPIQVNGVDGTGVGMIAAWDGTSARISINGNGGAANLERSGAEFGYIAFYDNGEELTLQKVREIFETSSLDNVNMAEFPFWIPLDSENVTIEDIKYKKITMGDVLDSTGARSGAIPRSQGKKVYFEIEILDQGDSTTAIRPGIRRMITAADVGDQTTVGEDGNEHHFYIDGTDLRVDRATLVHAGATDQSTGRVYGFAINWESGDFWVSEDGTWLQGDPETGTSPSGTLDITTTWAAHVWNNGADGNAVALLLTDEASLNYKPTGFDAWVPFAGVLEPEVYGPNRREFAVQRHASEYIKEYKFENGPGGTPNWLEDTAGNRPPYHDTLTQTGTAPYENEPVGCELTTGNTLGVLPDSSFTASSFFNASYEAKDARLNNTESWAPATTTLGQFLIIDMLQVRTLVGMQTQGGPIAVEWVITCLVEVSTDGSTFTPIVDGILNFNTDQNTVVENLITPVSARWVKFTPQTWQAFMDMRVELLVKPEQVSQASQTSIVHPENIAAEFSGNQGELEELRAYEFHYRHRLRTGATQASMIDSSANGNINLGNGNVNRNFPSWHNNFNNQTFWENIVDALGDDLPHQIFESCEPDNGNAGFVCIDGMPVEPDLLTAGTAAQGICGYFNTSSNAAFRFNGDANDGDAARASARMAFSRAYRGLAKQFSLYEVRKIFEAGAILEPAKVYPAGLQDGTILDAQLTASSEFNANLGPEYARLYSGGGFHWAPLASTTAEWWKIDFGKVVTVDSLILQGSSGNNNWLTSFKLEYNFDDSATWTPYNSDETISNSPNTSEDPIYHKLIPFRCRYLRIRPQTWNSFISIRCEFFLQRNNTGRVQDMYALPRWFVGDQVNCTVGGINDKDLTCGDVTDNTGGRSGAIPRNDKIYFEVQIVAQGDTTASNLLGLRKLAEPSNVGFDPATATDEYHTDGAGDVQNGQDVSLGITGTLGTAATGRIFQFAIDWNTGDWWMGTDNTLWAGVGGAGDPATGANPLDALDIDHNWAVVNRVNGANGNGQVRLITASGDLNYTPPNGFEAWEDSTL